MHDFGGVCRRVEGYLAETSVEKNEDGHNLTQSRAFLSLSLFQTSIGS